MDKPSVGYPNRYFVLASFHQRRLINEVVPAASWYRGNRGCDKLRPKIKACRIWSRRRVRVLFRDLISRPRRYVTSVYTIAPM